jgi:hypothetical protein
VIGADWAWVVKMSNIWGTGLDHGQPQRMQSLLKPEVKAINPTISRPSRLASDKAMPLQCSSHRCAAQQTSAALRDNSFSQQTAAQQH